MWELDYKESWVPKNWYFWTLELEKTFLRVPWTERRSSRSILKEISTEYSLEGLMLKLKLQYFSHLMQSWLIWKDPNSAKDWRQKDWRGQQRMRWLDIMTDSMVIVWVNSGSWWWTGRPGVLQFMGSQRVGHDWMTEINWTELQEWTHVSCISCTGRQILYHCITWQDKNLWLGSISFFNTVFMISWKGSMQILIVK